MPLFLGLALGLGASLPAAAMPLVAPNGDHGVPVVKLGGRVVAVVDSCQLNVDANIERWVVLTKPLDHANGTAP